jgi:ABC-type lipoprotein export system ATPase subunit
MNDPAGSKWRKWDLHVHTPASIFQLYGGDSEQTWEKFLQDLEKLPPEFKVLGINDYTFINGYRRLLKEKKQGRLQNIDRLLPVVELRLDKFGGSQSHLKKVNFHVIFSDEVDVDLIETQFINGLWTQYHLNPRFESVDNTWRALPTIDSIRELGERIIESVPAAERKNFNSPLAEGFGNITFKHEQVLEVLKKPYFHHRHLFAVGKTEWASIQWNDNSIADKKHVINSVDLVFIAAGNPGEAVNARTKLREGGVNHHLLDCSDAHTFSTENNKDRIGNSFTWIKADTTFIGLRHAILEFDDRVFIGEEPPKLKEVRQNKTHYINAVSFNKTPGSHLTEKWFSGQLPLNSDLVAIIGNKGNGKSALADTIALMGNSQQQRYFSFLNQSRFRDPKQNKAKEFEARLLWASGDGKPKSLDASVGPSEVELVKYIPQNFLEEICNKPDRERDSDFDEELQKLIFSHVPPAERLDQSSLDDLLSFKTIQTVERITSLRGDLSQLNALIAHEEDKLSPLYEESVKNAFAARMADLDTNQKVQPVPVAPPPSADQIPGYAEVTKAISDKTKHRASLLQERANIEQQQAESARVLSAIDRVVGRIANFEKAFQSFKDGVEIDLSRLGVSFDSLVQVSIKTDPLVAMRAEAAQIRSVASDRLDPSQPTSLPAQVKATEDELGTLQAELDEPSRKYQGYLQELEEWTQKQTEINGDTETPGSLFFLKAQLDDIGTVPQRLAPLYAERKTKTKEIYEEIVGLAKEYRELHRGVKKFIDEHPIAKDQLQLNFAVSIEQSNFETRFLDKINHTISGSFCGIGEGRAALQTILLKYDFNEWSQLEKFLDEVVENLHEDKRTEELKRVEVKDQLRKGHTVPNIYDYVFSLQYLSPQYTLKLGNKDLAQLSPGEKGALLLIFYLLVDRGQIPLVIDQPEGNLDNQTMFELLVPCLKEAKKNRQVIIVTHNPNLAVVADAEQVIHASLDKLNQNEMIYTSGALENPTIKAKVVDVLEGTKPAFSNRAQKYAAEGV